MVNRKPLENSTLTSPAGKVSQRSETQNEVKSVKRVVSVSLGSSKRDHRCEVELLGVRLEIARIGTDGDMAKAVSLLQELDGQVAAFGLGGIDRYLFAGKRRYEIRDANRLVRAVRRTPVVDGSGLKNTLEREVVRFLRDGLGLDLKGRKALLVSAVDRFGMAEALADAGADLLCGDLIFALGVPIPLRSLRSLRILAALLLPILTRLPFTFLYPTGTKQDRSMPRHTKYFQWADLIAGDYLFIKRNMPADLTGKIILTNTVTASDLEELRRRGAGLLVTTTPEFSGRSFGTNVMEAVIVALSGKDPEAMTEEDYRFWLDRLGFKPRVVRLDGLPPTARA